MHTPSAANLQWSAGRLPFALHGSSGVPNSGLGGRERQLHKSPLIEDLRHFMRNAGISLA
jgi:hypothetical protein